MWHYAVEAGVREGGVLYRGGVGASKGRKDSRKISMRGQESVEIRRRE